MLANASSLVNGGHASVVPRARHTPKHGKYTLRIAIAHSDGSYGNAQQTVQLG